MIVYRIAGRRRVRAGLILGSAVGWIVVAIGAALDRSAVISMGAVLAGAANMVVLKMVLESRSTVDAASAEHRSLAAEMHRAHCSTTGRLDRLEYADREIDGLRRDLDAAVQSVTGPQGRHEAAISRLMTSQDDAAKRAARLEQAGEVTRTQLGRLEQAHGSTVDALALTRTILDKLATRVPSAVTSARLATLARQHVDRPLLSIAIPSFNRPDLLAECLDSLEREIRGECEDAVEVCIMDDSSTDPDTIEVAADFAERCRFASVRRQPANVGIERNVIAACQPCRGDYILLLGNDDLLVPGAVARMLADLRIVAAPVHLYEKTRITVDGKPRAAVAGSSPIDVPPGDSHRFPSLLDAARRQGFVSTFGFISHKVFRRAPFVAIDPTEYFDLTMYAQVFTLVEAFADAPVFYRNEPTVFHRTASQSHKRVEALGRREATFMSGGVGKEARYFGTTLAAAWQRLIDRKGFDAAFLAEQPENLMTTLPLLSWIVRNRALDAGMDDTLDRRIVADADRFLTAFDLESTA